MIFDKAFAMPCVTDNFGFKKEERFDCGAKAGDVFAGQRRFPQQMYWDYKVGLGKADGKKKMIVSV